MFIPFVFWFCLLREPGESSKFSCSVQRTTDQSRSSTCTFFTTDNRTAPPPLYPAPPLKDVAALELEVHQNQKFRFLEGLGEKSPGVCPQLCFGAAGQTLTEHFLPRKNMCKHLCSEKMQSFFIKQFMSVNHKRGWRGFVFYLNSILSTQISGFAIRTLRRVKKM